jgi:hypothetical protein
MIMALGKRVCGSVKVDPLDGDGITLERNYFMEVL